MKTAKDYLEEANAAVSRVEAAEAVSQFGAPNTVFLDVRDSGAIAGTGTIEGAVQVPRGMLEFAADENTDFHNAALTKDANIMVVCAAGGQAALAGKTLKDMGYTSVTNIGGFGAWKDAGGPTEGTPDA
ncbi:MAG: rhodanese-like domain-containing protein [Pseudomonadota bacterium]